MYNPKFDIDLAFGEKTEQWIKLLGSNSKIEVKTERDTWLQTGNIAIEYMCRGKLSGISTTEADWWIHALSAEDKILAAFIWRVESLKKFLRPAWDGCSHLKLVTGGDDNQSNLILLPIRLAHEII